MRNLLLNIAGHSIHQKGAKAFNGKFEHDYTRDLQKRVTKLASELTLVGDTIKPKWVVVEDCETLSLHQVINSIGDKGRGIDIHFNNNNPAASGTETIINENTSQENKILAINISKAISDELGIRNRGVKLESESHLGVLGILSKTKIPVIIIEVCFLNERDMNKYIGNEDKVARAIVNELNKTLI